MSIDRYATLFPPLRFHPNCQTIFGCWGQQWLLLEKVHRSDLEDWSASESNWPLRSNILMLSVAIQICLTWPGELLLCKLEYNAAVLTLPILGLLSAKAQGRKYFWKPSKPCHVGIHRKALAECYRTSTHVQRFPSFFRFSCIILYWSAA